MKPKPLSFLKISIIGLFLLSGCVGSSVRGYYVLSAAGTPPAQGGGKLGTGIGIGPVNLAPYLSERQNLVFQSSPYRMEFSQNHVWAGDLEDNFTRVLGSNLGRRARTGNIKVYPWQKEQELSYQVTVDVVRFHGSPDGDAILEANWRLYRLPSGRLMKNQNTVLRDDLRKDGFEELAASQSRLIDQLSAVIASYL